MTIKRNFGRFAALFSGREGKEKPPVIDSQFRLFNGSEVKTLRVATETLKDVNQASFNLISALASAQPKPNSPYAESVLAVIRENNAKISDVLVECMRSGLEGRAKLSSPSFNRVAAKEDGSTKPLDEAAKETVVSIARGASSDLAQLLRIIRLYETSARFLDVEDGQKHYRHALGVRDTAQQRLVFPLQDMLLDIAKTLQPK